MCAVANGNPIPRNKFYSPIIFSVDNVLQNCRIRREIKKLENPDTCYPDQQSPRGANTHKTVEFLPK